MAINFPPRTIGIPDSTPVILGALSATYIWNGQQWISSLGGDIVVGSGTQNRLSYWSGTKTITSKNDLFFDGTNVGIGTIAPNEKLTISGNISSTQTVFASGGQVIVSSPSVETLTSGLSTVANIVALSQTTYDSLTIKRPDTYYIIV
jgi:hypothetical protein